MAYILMYIHIIITVIYKFYNLEVLGSNFDSDIYGLHF